MQIPIHSMSRLLQGMEICYTLTEKAVLTLIHTTRCLRKTFSTYKINVITNVPMEKMLKNPGTSGQLALWEIELNTYHISYIPREEVEGKVVEKFFYKRRASVASSGRGRQQGLRSKEGTSRRINPKDKEYSHAVRLNFHAFEDDMECEAFLAGLAAATGRQMKDLHMFVNSKLLVDQVEGNREKRAKMYREEVMDTQSVSRQRFPNHTSSTKL
ncbi:hypothetical protein Tco_1428617 [Tanacetum coccineum]